MDMDPYSGKGRSAIPWRYTMRRCSRRRRSNRWTFTRVSRIFQFVFRVFESNLRNPRCHLVILRRKVQKYEYWLGLPVIHAGFWCPVLRCQRVLNWKKEIYYLAYFFSDSFLFHYLYLAIDTCGRLNELRATFVILANVTVDSKRFHGETFR